MAPQVSPLTASRGSALLWGVVSVLSLGLVGLLLTLPPVRRRRAERTAGCSVCRRQRRCRRTAAAVLTVLLLLGAVGRTWAVASPPRACSTTVSADGSEPADDPLGPSHSLLWTGARGLVTAPVSGLALLGSSAAGMSTCDARPVLVTFRPEASGGGTTVGDTFVAWMPTAEHRDPRLETLGVPSGRLPYGDVGGRPFGPQITSNRADAHRLAAHESRHTDQWTVSTLLAGPLAYPSLYFVTDAVLPGGRNPFERDAGLDAGGYDAPSSSAPAPRWATIAVLAILLLLVLARRLRWLSRVVRGGRPAALAHAADRCPVHSPGWFAPPGS